VPAQDPPEQDAAPALPIALHHHGANHGEAVWFGFPKHFFDPEQAREVARVAARVLGIQPSCAAPVAIRRR
jgi:hypothetical protein